MPHWGLGDAREQKVEWKDLPLLPPDADCPLREASSRKIPRLTVKVRGGQLVTPAPPGSPHNLRLFDQLPSPVQAREHCLGLLEEALSSNRQAAGSTDG